MPSEELGRERTDTRVFVGVILDVRGVFIQPLWLRDGHRLKMQREEKNQCMAFKLQNRLVKFIGSDNRVIKYF